MPEEGNNMNSLINDVVSVGQYTVTYNKIEIGSLGHFTMDSINH